MLHNYVYITGKAITVNSISKVTREEHTTFTLRQDEGFCLTCGF